MSNLIGQYQNLGWIGLKTLSMFVLAVIGLRLSKRRTLAELNVVDLVVAVAIGAIVGRTATSSSTSVVTGAVSVGGLLVAHRITMALHLRGWLGGVLDRRPLVLLEEGRLCPSGLRSAGLTERDVYRLLRQAGETELQDLDFVLFEEQGALTIVRSGDRYGAAVRIGLTDAGVDADRDLPGTQTKRRP